MSIKCSHSVLLYPCCHLFSSSIRSPGPVTPRDVECEGFDLTYTRIASDHSVRKQPPSSYSPMENDVDKKVDDAIESFLRSLTQIGPELLSVRCKKRLICPCLVALNGHLLILTLSIAHEIGMFDR